MKSLIYDTETNGLPIWSSPSEDPAQPRVTQLCAELIDDNTGEVHSAMHAIIKPEGWVIPPDLEELTGITTAKAIAVGIRMAEVLPMFIGMWHEADHRVAHNESFDMRMVRIELMRHPMYKDLAKCFADGRPDAQFADYWKAGKAFCTQAQSQTIINLPPTDKMRAAKRFGPKPPNLGEAYQHFTGKPLENAHNASVDVMACKAVYLGILAARLQQPQAA